MFQCETLYTIDTTGRMRQWRMELEGDKYRTISGLVDGKQVTSKWKVAKPKNVGKKNETSPEEQAAAEIVSEYAYQEKTRYCRTQEEAIKWGGAKFYAPMLAEKFGDVFKKKPPVFPCWSQPKLDGIRCILKKDGAWTREGEPIPSIVHIQWAFEHIFEKFPTAVFDGELYNHDLKHDFGEIASKVRKSTGLTPAILDQVAAVVQYHTYDMPSIQGGFNARFNTLESFVTGIDCVKLVRAHKCENIDELDNWYANYLMDGYEGQMVRYDEKYEKDTRSKSLLKRKEFQDMEVEILEIIEGEGNWSGGAKAVRVRLPNGIKQKSSMRGSEDFAKQIFIDREEYTHCTVRFQGFTPDGKMRFPVVTDFQKGRRLD